METKPFKRTLFVRLAIFLSNYERSMARKHDRKAALDLVTLCNSGDWVGRERDTASTQVHNQLNFYDKHYAMAKQIFRCVHTFLRGDC